MNQAILAGVGNVYADEILYQAGITPGRRLDKLDEKNFPLPAGSSCSA